MNRVVPPGEVIPAALAFAQAIIAVSPDSVQATKRALNEASMTANLDEAVERSATSKESRAVYGGENIKVRTTPCADSDRSNINDIFPRRRV